MDEQPSTEAEGQNDLKQGGVGGHAALCSKSECPKVDGTAPTASQTSARPGSKQLCEVSLYQQLEAQLLLTAGQLEHLREIAKHPAGDELEQLISTGSVSAAAQPSAGPHASCLIIDEQLAVKPALMRLFTTCELMAEVMRRLEGVV